MVGQLGIESDFLGHCGNLWVMRLHLVILLIVLQVTTADFNIKSKYLYILFVSQ